MRPTSHRFFIFFENIVSLLLGQLVFLSMKCTMQVGHRQGKSGYLTINFEIRENQKISPFLEKIRDTSGDFIIDKGKNKGYMIFLFDFPENVFEL